MRQELDELLYKLAPNLYRQRNMPMNMTCMCWGFPGDGWFGLLLEASLAIEAILVQLPEGQRPSAVQVKEKYGTLRFYMTGYNDEIDVIIRRAEQRSAVECEECGAAAKRRGDGWIKTLCDAHASWEGHR